AHSVWERIAASETPVLIDGFPKDSSNESLIHNLQEYALNVSKKINYIAQDSEERHYDAILARACLDLAQGRHAGKIEEHFTPMGRVNVQEGKDLRGAAALIGVGGVFSFGDERHWIVEGA